MGINLTPLEAALLARFQSYQSDLPAPSELLVTEREITGAGRFTYLRKSHGGNFAINPDGTRVVHSLPDLIEMDEVSIGLGAILFVEAPEIVLELITYGGDWDGVERPWRIKESADDR